MTLTSLFDDIKTGIRIALLSIYHGITHIKLLGFLFILTALFLAVGINPFFFEPITDIFSTLQECAYPDQLCASTFLSFFTTLIALVLRKTLVTILLFGLMLYASEILQKGTPTLREELKKGWLARRALLTPSLVTIVTALLLSLLFNLITHTELPIMPMKIAMLFLNISNFTWWVIQMLTLATLAHGEQSITHAITTALRLLRSYCGTIITSYLTLAAMYGALASIFFMFLYFSKINLKYISDLLTVDPILIATFFLIAFFSALTTTIEAFLVTALYQHTQNK